MLHAVAQGDFELLDYYNLRKRLESRGFLSWLVGPDRKSFNVIWVNGFGKRLDEVIHSILTRRRERHDNRLYGAGLLSYLSSEADQIEVATKIGFDKVFVAEDELKEIHVPEKPINIKEGFEIAIQRYGDSYTDQLLIIIDEFETIQNRAEIAFYLKNIPNVRFVLVGIAETTFDLIGQHSSIARQIHAIKLEPMTAEELKEILDVGAFQLRKNCKISPDVIRQIVGSSYRSPYWCHFFAKTLLQDYLESEKSFENFRRPQKNTVIINNKGFNEMISGLQDNAECRLFEEQLKMVTLEDDINWSVLNAIAKQEDTVIISKKIVDQVSKSSNISESDIKATIHGFLDMQDGPFEVKSEIRDTRSFVFRDPNFKRYILVRGQKQV